MIQEPEVEVKPAARMLRASESFGRLEAEMRDGRVGERTVEAFRGFSTEAWQLISLLQLKQLTESPETYSVDFYSRYFQLFQLLERRQREWQPLWAKERYTESPQVGPRLEQDFGKIVAELRKVTMGSLRVWIKFTYRELFQGSEDSVRTKNLLFICMDYLDEAARTKQYSNFNEKIYKDVDELNKEANPAPKLRLVVDIMETLVDKLPRSRSLFYEKGVNMKVISYLHRVESGDQAKIFSLLNAYLPVLNPALLTAQLEEYLAYLLDLLNHYKPAGKSIVQILYKAARSGSQKLLKRISRIVVGCLEAGSVEGFAPLISLILESDRQLSLVNAELDIKTYLYDRYRDKIKSFLPEKQNLLEIDLKGFSVGLSKYENGAVINEAGKRLFIRKENVNKCIYYDCKEPKNNFGFSVCANVDFISYSPRFDIKLIIRYIICNLFRSDPEAQDEQLAQLHRILGYFRILLPFALQEKVEGSSLLEWLLDNPSQSKRKYKLLEFLLLNCNILVKKGQESYCFFSIADYVCARTVSHLLTRDYQTGQYQPILACLYLQQVRRFSQFCATPFSATCKDTVTSFFEKLFERANPLQYLAISEFLNVQYKRILLNNLRRKYTIAGNEGESIFERQFLNVSAFYSSLPLREDQNIPSTNPRRNSNNNGPRAVEMQMMEDGSDSEEENYENIGNLGRPALLHGGNYFYGLGGNYRAQIEGHYEQIIVPLPQKPLKEGEEQPVLQPIVLINNFTVTEVLELFEQLLSFEGEIQGQFEIEEAGVPQKAIKMGENLPFKVSLPEGAIDLELRVKKNANFERHFGEIVQVFDPKAIWQERRAPSNFERRVQEISRRMLAGEHRSQMMHQLERLMASRENREEEAVQRTRFINATDIAVQQPPQAFVEPMHIERQQAVKQVLIVEAPSVLPVVIEPVQQQPVQQQPVQQQPVQQQPVQQQPVQQQPAQQQPVQQQMVLQQPVQQQPVQQQPVQQQPVQQQPVQQQIIQHQPIQEQLVQEQVPVIPPPAEVPQDQQPPVRDRQILRIFGLPQTFLRDAGIDEESFDCLPEDLQQEQLMNFISQQNHAINRPNQAGSRNNNPNNPNNPNNLNPHQPVTDLQNDNVAFLASLDILTRAQVLIEATPDFLNTLPANIREQAENYRHQQINRIIEEEEIEEERKMAGGRPKQNIVYPKVFKEEFSSISEVAAKRLFEGIFYIFPSFKLPAVKLLLENKQTQGKAVASIIAILRYLQLKEENKLFSLKKVERGEDSLNTIEYFQWSEQETQDIRVTLLHTIYENLKIPFYKDEEFLSKPLSIELYFDNLKTLFEGEESINPEFELFQYSLKYYPALSSELIKGIKDLPDKVLVKIVDRMKANALPMDFYDHLQNFSENERLKELFNSQFQQNGPKIQVLCKLLRYKFSQSLPSLRRIHEEALKEFSSTNYEFFNQIFRIYTIESVQEIEHILVKHKRIHFQVIKYLLQLSKEIEKEPIGLLLKRPTLLDFETKKLIFRNHPRLRSFSRHRVHIEVDRTHLFQGSYNQLMSRSVRELEGRIQVSFVNEPGYDAGGLKREWFLVVSREIFNQDYALFEKSSSGSTYQPNPKSYINPDHLNYFKFIGRFIGKALVERELIDAYFTRAFYKMILGQELEFKDLEAQDYEFYKSMEWLMINPIDENMFTFSYIYDNFGNRIEKELVPGGKAIIVNEENKKEYIEKYCLAKMRDDFSSQVNKFLEGFHEIVPQDCVSYFQAKQLELLISGVPEVDVEDLKQNTDYSGYAPTDQIILWFWEVVEEYSQQDLAKLVQFITGTSKIPVEGFSQLVGMNGIQRISIHRDPCEHQLPKSHTCFNQLDLPNYSSKEILKQKLSICLAWGSEGFGFM